MPDTATSAAAAPVVYVTDLTYEGYEPADLFDIAFLLRSPNHDLRAVCLVGDGDGNGDRVVDALAQRARPNAHFQTATGCDAMRIAQVLKTQELPVNLVVVAGFSVVAELLGEHREMVRAKVTRIFVVGGHVNEYRTEHAVGKERVPIDPRLRERNPDSFQNRDFRFSTPEEQKDWACVLTSGEAIIWLPRDICLWRYAAAGVLEDGGRLCEFLLREMFWTNAVTREIGTDRYALWEKPALLSALPAFLLAFEPDTAAWMRLFRALPARVEADEAGNVATFATRTDAPNIYAVIAIDGQACGKLLTARLRDRPLQP